MTLKSPSPPLGGSADRMSDGGVNRLPAVWAPQPAIKGLGATAMANPQTTRRMALRSRNPFQLAPIVASGPPAGAGDCCSRRSSLPGDAELWRQPPSREDSRRRQSHPVLESYCGCPSPSWTTTFAASGKTCPDKPAARPVSSASPPDRRRMASASAEREGWEREDI